MISCNIVFVNSFAHDNCVVNNLNISISIIEMLKWLVLLIQVLMSQRTALWDKPTEIHYSLKIFHSIGLIHEWIIPTGFVNQNQINQCIKDQKNDWFTKVWFIHKSDIATSLVKARRDFLFFKVNNLTIWTVLRQI